MFPFTDEIRGKRLQAKFLHCGHQACTSNTFAAYTEAALLNLLLSLYITSHRYPFCVFSMKAAELKCQNLIVKKVCQVEHFKTFRRAIGPELGLKRPKISATEVRCGEVRDRVHWRIIV